MPSDPRFHVARRVLMQRATVFATLVVLATVVSAQVAPDAGTAVDAKPALWEHWYTLQIDDATAGWMRETAHFDGTQYRTAGEMQFKISRGPIELEVTMKSEFVETEDGEPIRYWFLQDLALQSVETVWEFGPEEVTVIANQGGRELRKTMPLPEGPWLTPMEIRRYWTARREAGAKEIAYRMLEGEYGLEPIALQHEFAGREQLAVGDRTIPVTVWKSTTTAMPGVVATSKMSEDGHLVYEEAPLPFGRMITRVATKEQAMAAGDAPAPELMVTNFVAVDRPINRPRSARTAVLRVRVKEGTMPELPSAGAQRVEPQADATIALLRIDIDDALPAAASDLTDSAYREASSMANNDDELIRKLARSACRGITDPLAKAEAMRRFTHRHISAKSLDTAFASASETARMRTGDCSEHGVLLCAMLRAEGIPARVATGLVYADTFAGQRDIFGWHMWTQALIDGRWVDFDATLDRRYDAAHVLTGTSSLAEGMGTGDMNLVMMLMGNIEVDVVEVGYE